MDQPNDNPIAPTDTRILLSEVGEEFLRILDFWKKFSPDNEQGGFAGQMDRLNRYNRNAAKGVVLNARILWTFSAAYTVTKDSADLAMADRAFEYIRQYFSDPGYGGLFWTVDAAGRPLDTHKQVYAHAFGIYGMSEYYRATGKEQALRLAIDWYQLIERYSRDPVNRGYTDAFTRDWSFLEDKRLSAKDSNAAKTMNTHIHIIEAYANLYEVWNDPQLRLHLEELLAIFQEKILDRDSYHLHLFFEADWTRKPGPVSFGHDIEASWLLQSCAEVTGNDLWISLTRANALRITEAATEGLDDDGGLWCDRDENGLPQIQEKHWWPQAEALIGFCNAWEISGDLRYLQALFSCWKFIQTSITDKVNGEWLWGVDARRDALKNEDKIGLWKCPYHNVRACMQLLRRLPATGVRSFF